MNSHLIKLTDVPFDKIKVGDIIISYTGIPGTVTSFDPGEVDHPDRGLIRINWVTGNFTHGYIFNDGSPWYDQIWWVDFSKL